MVVGEVGVCVESFVFRGGMGELGKDHGYERGRVARGDGGVFSEDLVVVGNAGAGVIG